MAHRKKLAAKMSILILSGVAVIFLLIMRYNYVISKNLILKQTEKFAYSLCQSVLHQIENQLLPAQKIPDRRIIKVKCNTGNAQASNNHTK